LFTSDPFGPANQCDLGRPCDPRVRCTNTMPGYRCDPCPTGYTGSSGIQGIGLEFAQSRRQICYDINECETNNGGCVPNSQCVNSEVSWRLNTHNLSQFLIKSCFQLFFPPYWVMDSGHAQSTNSLNMLVILGNYEYIAIYFPVFVYFLWTRARFTAGNV
jgi:hypothetical protein